MIMHRSSLATESRVPSRELNYDFISRPRFLANVVRQLSFLIRDSLIGHEHKTRRLKYHSLL